MENNVEKNLDEQVDDCNVEENLEENAESNTAENIEEIMVEDLKSENVKLQDEVTKLQNELEALKDRLARTLAEYDNFRKRSVKEKEGIYTDACEDVLKEMLPVLDNLERAVGVDGSADDIKQGVDMTIKQFNNALEKLNVEEIKTDGEFNPHIHNAVMHVQDEQFGVNQVVEVFQKGYKRGEKVLRYSMVKVAN